MKAKCTPCLGSDIKKALRTLGDIGVDLKLDKIPDCPVSMEIDFCAKADRKKSDYQIFVSDCMKSKPIKGKPFGEASKYMKECAVEWRKRKEDNNGAHDSKVHDTPRGQLE